MSGAVTDGIGRDEILKRFERMLDSTLAGEAPPPGVDPILLSDPGAREERSCDSYALWSATIALTQEIKLQGRAFQELNHTLDAQTGRMLEELRAVYTERERSLERETERRCRKEILGALIDLRDRLGRGRDTVRARERDRANVPAPGWRERLFAPKAADPSAPVANDLIRGYELGVERLDQTLDEFNAREIRCEGEKFDPRRMNALDSEETGTVGPDIVLEVYRSGYEWNGEVFRPAQVKVSRAPAAGKNT